MSRRDLVLLIIVGVIGVAVGGYFGGSWYIRDVNRLRQEKTAKEAELKLVEQKVRDLAAVEQRLAEATQLQADYERLVPAKEELPQLLRDTETILSTAGADLSSFAREAPTPAPVAGLSQLTVVVRATGSYQEILAMFQALRSWHRLIGITNFALTAGGSRDAENPPLACQFNMLVYFANQPEAAK